MDLLESRALLNEHVERGDVRRVAEKLRVKPTVAQAYLNGHRKESKGARRYLLALADVISERREEQARIDTETANQIREILS